LGGRDLDFENLIADGEYGVVIDVESVFEDEVGVEFGMDGLRERKWMNEDCIIMRGVLGFIWYGEG
ncbi:DUF4135 domain-containing protein, partial [Bacillus thuringiensis]|uniref:DUF4135 domain-containing protein n=1 Tax=Bacillus thuringiensis TaxID=1428 RepID=UPI001642D5CF